MVIEAQLENLWWENWEWHFEKFSVGSKGWKETWRKKGFISTPDRTGYGTELAGCFITESFFVLIMTLFKTPLYQAEELRFSSIYFNECRGVQ